MQVKNTEKFKQIYRRLNPAQKEAVDTLDGPVMVVAGPGTGKTQVLTARIANILLKTDTDPSAIMALTFTESAAQNMRDRLVKMIGETGYYVHISTFHSFCSQVIKENPDHFSIGRDSQALTDLERYELYERLLDENSFEKLKPINAPYFYLRDIVKAVSDLKREGVSPDKFEQMIEDEQEQFKQEQEEMTKTEARKFEKNLAKHQDLLKLYRQYQQRLRDRLRFDFDDMIALVVEAFENDELFLRDYQEKLHYFLVDEYQDTNTAQNRVVDLLASYWQELNQQPNIFVVGDPNQSIYRFQGASVENMLGFVDRYQQSTIISLGTGYRCPQKIYDAASELISHNQLIKADKPDSKRAKLFKLLNLTLESAAPEVISGADSSSALDSSKNAKLRLFKAPVQTLETIFIAEEIKELTANGVDPSDIAILFRYNSDEAEIAQALEKWNIRFEIDGGDDVLKSETINQLLKFFQVLVDLRDSNETQFFYEIMQYDWFTLDSLATMKLGRIAGKLRMSLADVIDQGYEALSEGDDDFDQLLTPLEFEQFTQFYHDLAQWSQLDFKHTFNQWFEVVLKESGFIDWLQQQPNKIDLLNQLNSLYNQIKSMTSTDHQFKLADFLQAIKVMREHRLKIDEEDLNIRQNAVHLSTVHKAKGQEWDYVYIIHCVDGKWGNRRPRDMIPLPEGILKNTDLSQKERNEDERRVFYVALTRAKKQVTVTYPETIVQDNQSRDAIASQFIAELEESGSDGIELVTAEKLIDEADDYLVRLIEPPQLRTVQTAEKQFFQRLVKNFRLSVTALNSYLKDPQDFIDNNLLRLPRAKPMPMVFGTAVHQALEKMFSYYQDAKEKPPEKYLLQQFEQALKKEVLTKRDFKDRLEYGQKILKNYYQKTLDQEPNVFEVERFIGSGWSRAMLGDIGLSGRLDRVDWVDQANKQVMVIDYKTGKPKTKGYIEGQTKSAGLSEREQSLPDSVKGPYKRQLLFYKLLAQLDRTFIPEVTHGMFDFVEPYDKRTGRLMPRKFVLQDEDVNDLKNLIQEVMSEIRSLEFLKQA